MTGGAGRDLPESWVNMCFDSDFITRCKKKEGVPVASRVPTPTDARP